MRLYRLLQSLILSLTRCTTDAEREAVIRRAMSEAGMTDIAWSDIAELRAKLEAMEIQAL